MANVTICNTSYKNKMSFIKNIFPQIIETKNINNRSDYVYPKCQKLVGVKAKSAETLAQDFRYPKTRLSNLNETELDLYVEILYFAYRQQVADMQENLTKIKTDYENL